MRILSILTAVVVSLVLYGIVFERDRLVNFAGRDGAAQDTAPDTTAPTAAPAPTTAPPRIAVVVTTSTASQVDTRVALRGQTQAARQVAMQAEISGRVVSEPLRQGRLVERGDTLCEIDPGTRPAMLAEAEARLAEAQISDTAAARLAEGGFASETRAVGAKASLQAARAAVEMATTDLDRLVITAPFAGVLDTDTAELGSLMQPGTLCGTILQLDPIKVVAYVPETLVDQIETGAAAQARLASGRMVDGTVTFLSRSADPQTRTFQVDITAPNPDLAIRDGQSADIAIESQGVAAHRVAASALTLDNTGAMGLRVVDDTDTVQFFPVRVVRDTLDGVIVTGLPDRVRIITTGQEFVTQGVTVRATEAAESGT